MSELKNAIRIHRANVSSIATYAYFDLPEYYLDPLCIQECIKVHFRKREWVNKDWKYIVCLADVRKKDREAFERALSKLVDKMLVMGHTDYPEFCERTIKKLSDALAEMRKEKEK